ncbi:flagellin [Sporomusa aerivorans]|uniref:flagellin N-terminal helical domain-containing protein n=1 Tax=Sporomusa aerivorans TaxID=204936 RepID=UPI00352BBEA5
MAMVISTNMSALNTTNQLNKNSTLMNSALEKLSSGYSINSAADNAAGLAISEKMRAQIEGLDQASSNSQDAISLAQTADGALDETNEILKRMRELAVQASSDTLTDDDRSAIQDEVDTLRQEIDRISNDTEYNTIKLLNGSSGASVAVTNASVAGIVTTATASNNTKSGSYDVVYTSIATQATTGVSGITTTIDNTSAASAAATVISDYAGDIEINGTTITIESGDTVKGLIEKINNESDTTGVTASLATDASGNYYVKLTDSTYGSKSSVTLEADSDTLQDLFAAIDSSSSTATSVTVYGTNATGTINGAVALGDGNTLSAFGITVTGDDSKLAVAAASATGYASTIAAVTDALDDLVSAMSASTASTSVDDVAAATAYKDALSNGNATAINNALQALLKQASISTDASISTASTGLLDVYKSKVKDVAALSVATTSVNVDASSSLTFQVGANSSQTMSLSIGDMDANSLGVAGSTSDTGIDLSSAEVATSAISTIDKAISKVASERSNLGAVQNSLESNINMLDTESENLTSAESNIRDTDMASVMAEYTKLSVITQAATAMLAKANSQPQQVLTLLQG